MSGTSDFGAGQFAQGMQQSLMGMPEQVNWLAQNQFAPQDTMLHMNPAQNMPGPNANAPMTMMANLAGGLGSVTNAGGGSGQYSALMNMPQFRGNYG